jgi:acyl-CoA oxidase
VFWTTTVFVQHANHTAAFAQLIVNGENKGVHAFVVPIRDRQGRLLRGVRILDCGHKMGLNGVDNGRIW